MVMVFNVIFLNYVALLAIKKCSQRAVVYRNSFAAS